ncbi:serine hydrolase domain-containing protein [Nitrospira moscoviensis]|uniref:Putative Esterase, beta-lactamase family n=1 Tax=Nitrospira moscoviensis TaxID=42253 RepID=A0A0K2G814_NITMO|nr:serine hydrolase domain-containing protein [Nitrospira moscoviensis]ALA57070.1 putative Esterase, beta-lactamase family [Nitrospira moscoviensis]
MPHSHAIQTALDRAVSDCVFPGAVLGVRLRSAPASYYCAGRLSTQPSGPPVTSSTLYDLASLTKPLATVTALALLVQEGRCCVDDRVDLHLPECVGSPIGSATLRHLLTHSSGLPGWRAYYDRLSPDGAIPSSMEERNRAKQAMLELIRAEAPVYERDARSLYSDLGFILLGLIIERCYRQDLDHVFYDYVTVPLGGLRIEYVLAERLNEFLACANNYDGGVAPTEVDQWRGRLLCGEVHDQNAAALGGEAGHAGLFGTADAVLALTGEWLRAYHGRASLLHHEVAREFTRRQEQVPQSTWALGWDTPSVPSSSGRWFSPRSFGHLGYTGTSVWIDPDRELEVVLLSNRVHPTSKNDAIRAFRPAIHDLVYEEFLGRAQPLSG